MSFLVGTVINSKELILQPYDSVSDVLSPSCFYGEASYRVVGLLRQRCLNVESPMMPFLLKTQQHCTSAEEQLQ